MAGVVGQSGISAASLASAVAQRYREAESIQPPRVAAKAREFAAALQPEPSVVTTVATHAAATLAPPRLAPEPLPARPVLRTVLPSSALAKRGAAAYEAAAGGQTAGAGAQSPASHSGGLSIEC